jgi:hypothetical protein
MAAGSRYVILQKTELFIDQEELHSFIEKWAKKSHKRMGQVALIVV